MTTAEQPEILPVSSSGVIRLMSYHLSSPLVSCLTSLVSCPLPSSRGSTMASSFRMMLFPPREAMTTAEQTEILPISSSGVIRLASYHLSSPLVSCLTSLVSCPLPSSRGSAMATSFLMTSFALAKRLQPPSRRSRCFFSIQNSFYSNKFFSGLTVGGEAFSVIRVFCGFYNKKFSCPFVSFVVCQLMFFIMNSASRS